jgi:Ca-activated chloride channel homolog
MKDTTMNAGLHTKHGAVIPLKGVEVEGEVLGAHARVTVRQRYQHDGRKPVEAIYTFPLPADATLTGFSMTCDGRRFEGTVKEREAAFRAYDDALVAGHGAALVEQERPNVFTASVGNLLPGEETLIEVVYVQRVQVDEGSLRWMIPTLVAPRYIPGSASGDRTAHGESAPTDRVPDADRITPPRAADVPYGLRLDLRFDLGREVRVESPSHALTVTYEGTRARVRFAQDEVALDRDVVLTARGTGNGLAQTTGLAAHRIAGADGYLALSLVPDLFSLGAEASRATTVVFLIDVSGSMEGDSIREARAALRLCLRHLRGADRFNIIAFSSSHRAFEREPIAFDEKSLARADRWIEALHADGGTELLEPLTRATTMAAGGVVVLLTDGQVGNEDEILRAVLQRRGETSTRVCSFGIGTNVSDALLRDLARETGGAVEFIHPGERIDEKVVAQFSRAVAPRITDVRVRFCGVEASEVSPAKVPDLVDGESWSILARYARGGGGTAELEGRYRGEPFMLSLPLDLPDECVRPVVASLWAAERIRDLEDAKVEGRRAETMKQRIVELAVAHSVASRFTSFVVVEHRTGDRRVNAMPDTAVVPVNLPAGWAMFDTARREAAASVTRSGGATGSLKKKRAAPPSPAKVAASRQAPAPAPMGPMPAAFDDAGFADDADFEAPAFERRELRSALMDFMPLEASESAYDMAKEEAPADAKASPSPASLDLGALFAKQLASGLWDDASLPGTAAQRTLLATARVLVALVAADVDTTHALYGAPLRKALEAVAALAKTLSATEATRCEIALGAALVLATGARTRSTLTAAIEPSQHPTLDARRSDSVALRAWILSATL